MQELWPQPRAEIDVAARLAADERTPFRDRPWVTMIMIASVDGAIELDGVSGGLGGPADHERFVAARRMADAIVVGAGTVIAEDYQPAGVPLAVLTRTLSLDADSRLFSGDEAAVMLYTTAEAARASGDRFAGIAEVVNLGDSVEPTPVLADLRNRGLSSVLLEGGPTINGRFLAADVVDELLLTVSPLAVGGDGSRLAAGPTLGADHRFSIDRVLLADDLLFVRYLRRRGS